jgi:hypothetical protein
MGEMTRRAVLGAGAAWPLMQAGPRWPPPRWANRW